MYDEDDDNPILRINEQCELDDRWLEECESEDYLKSIDKKSKK